MQIKIDRLHQLLTETFQGNIYTLAEALQVEPMKAKQILKDNIDYDPTVVSAVINFCYENKLQYQEFLYL
jgi:hypothetical protein